MKRTFAVLLTFAGISITILPGCAKEKPGDKTIRLEFTKKALDYVQLEMGKYLVYKDSAISQLDSVVVTESRLSEVYLGTVPVTWQYDTWFQEPAHYEQAFYLTLTKYDGISSSAWFSGAAQAMVRGFVAIQNSADTMSMYMDGYAIFDTTTAFVFAHNMNPDYSINVDGKVYNNVAVTSYASEYYLPGDSSYESHTYYWAKGVGLIKVSIMKGLNVHTYTLLRHN